MFYRAQDDKGKGLRIIDVDTKKITVLTTGDHSNDNFPHWSPKGDLITFISDREDNDYEVYVIKPDGTGMRRITHIPGNEGHPVWSPDAQWIVFAIDKPLTLAAYESDLTVRAYVETLAVGDVLPDMPLFLQPDGCISVPLEASYQTTWKVYPRRWRDVIETK